MQIQWQLSRNIDRVDIRTEQENVKSMQRVVAMQQDVQLLQDPPCIYGNNKSQLVNALVLQSLKQCSSQIVRTLPG